MTKEKTQKIFQALKGHYPNAKMILEWSNNWELLVAIILSAQCTDKKVNEVTLQLFPKYKIRIPRFDRQYQNYSRIVIPNEEGNDPQDDKLRSEMITQLVNFAFVPLQELEQDVRSTGFYHNKANNIQAAARVVLDKYNGALPRSIKELITIPGVGRKTANVFLGNAYGIYEGIAVDTHVAKQSRLLGFTESNTPEKIEQDLMKLFPQTDWFALTYLLIEHGRNMRRKKSDRITCGKTNCLLCDNSSKR